MTTHKEAAAHYPVCEPFPCALDEEGRPAVRGMGKSFQDAQDRARALGLVRVGTSEVLTPRDTEQTFDGMILPGLSDDDKFPGITRWLGAVTLYYRPR